MFFNSLGTIKIFRSFKFSVYINVILLINFPEQFELCFCSSIREVMKLYNLGNRSFKTDFSFTHVPKIYRMKCLLAVVEIGNEESPVFCWTLERCVLMPATER